MRNNIEDLDGISIEYIDANHQRVILELLVKAGGNIHKNNMTINEWITKYGNQHYNIYIYNKNGIGGKQADIPISFKEFLSLYYSDKPKYLNVELNKEYSAQIYKDKLVVGCQEFPLSVIDKLYREKQEFLK